MMMKNISKILALIALSAILVPSCDIVEEPYLVPVNGGTGPEPGDNIRKVLLEDFTGQKCPNCPEGADLAHSLKAIYGEQLVILTVHAGYYAIPDATGDFTADFRTTEGTELNDYFEVYANPLGMVNRTKYSGNRVLQIGDWEAATEIQASLEPEAAITITNNYTPGTRTLQCTLETNYLESMEGTYNICAYITESGIISPQETEQGVNLTYEHNHVLRGSMNGTWGELAGEDGLFIVGTTVTNSYSYILPEAWNAANCSVVAFLYNTATNEVVQAEEKAF
jgi:hypothetical protein